MPNDAVAQAFGLSKIYGVGAAGVTALDDVTVEFSRGQLTAIMGPSGSGKSGHLWRPNRDTGCT
jgi:putative ABC transport system ATP-binding protein